MKAGHASVVRALFHLILAAAFLVSLSVGEVVVRMFLADRLSTRALEEQLQTTNREGHAPSEETLVDLLRQVPPLAELLEAPRALQEA